MRRTYRICRLRIVTIWRVILRWILLLFSSFYATNVHQLSMWRTDICIMHPGSPAFAVSTVESQRLVGSGCVNVKIYGISVVPMRPSGTAAVVLTLVWLPVAHHLLSIRLVLPIANAPFHCYHRCQVIRTFQRRCLVCVFELTILLP